MTFLHWPQNVIRFVCNKPKVKFMPSSNYTVQYRKQLLYLTRNKTTLHFSFKYFQLEWSLAMDGWLSPRVLSERSATGSHSYYRIIIKIFGYDFDKILRPTCRKNGPRHGLDLGFFRRVGKICENTISSLYPSAFLPHVFQYPLEGI